MVGKNRMKDWKASIRTWERRKGKENGRGQSPAEREKRDAKQEAQRAADRENQKEHELEIQQRRARQKKFGPMLDAMSSADLNQLEVAAEPDDDLRRVMPPMMKRDAILQYLEQQQESGDDTI